MKKEIPPPKEVIMACRMITDSLNYFNESEIFNILMSCLMTNFLNSKINKKEAIGHIQSVLNSISVDEWDSMLDSCVNKRIKSEKQNKEKK